MIYKIDNGEKGLIDVRYIEIQIIYKQMDRLYTNRWIDYIQKYRQMDRQNIDRQIDR